VKVTTHIHHWK